LSREACCVISKLVYGIYKRTICSGWGAAVPFHATIPLQLYVSDDLCKYVYTRFIPKGSLSARTKTHPMHARSTQRAALPASAPQHTASEVAGVRLTVCLRLSRPLTCQVTFSWRPGAGRATASTRCPNARCIMLCGRRQCPSCNRTDGADGVLT
jgi:hypothetical protein